MSCKAGWNRDFLYHNLTATFLNINYAKRRGELLYEREKALLAETMPIATMTKQIQGINEELRSITKEYDMVFKEYQMMKGNAASNHSRAELGHMIELQTAMSNLRSRTSTLYIRKRRLEMEILPNARPASTSASATSYSPRYIRPCAKEDCRGFIDTNMECSLCQSTYCKQCHECLNEGEHHACKEEDIQSAQMIFRDSKNCPSCHVITHKISGCSQMWCTLCHTAWNWSTGNIETSIVHNPHYFDYMRRNNLLPGQNGNAHAIGQPVCGGMEMEPYRIKGTIDRLKLAFHPGFIYHMLRLRSHVASVEIPRFQTNQVRENRDLRIKYLLNEITETRFKQLLQQREKRSAKKREFEQVMQMFNNVLLDLMAKFNTSSTQQEALAVEHEFHELCKYTNEAFERIGSVFNCKRPSIDKNTYTFVTV